MLIYIIKKITHYYESCFVANCSYWQLTIRWYLIYHVNFDRQLSGKHIPIFTKQKMTIILVVILHFLLNIALTDGWYREWLTCQTNVLLTIIGRLVRVFVPRSYKTTVVKTHVLFCSLPAMICGVEFSRENNGEIKILFGFPSRQKKISFLEILFH